MFENLRDAFREAIENFKREMMRSKKYRSRDIYPRLSPELEKLFEEWKKTHPKAGVKPK